MHFFQAMFIYNSEKVIKLVNSDLKDLPSEILNECPPEDLYLVKTAYSTENKFIITTDRKLLNDLENTRISVRLADEFMAEYCSR